MEYAALAAELGDTAEPRIGDPIPAMVTAHVSDVSAEGDAAKGADVPAVAVTAAEKAAPPNMTTAKAASPHKQYDKGQAARPKEEKHMHRGITPTTARTPTKSRTLPATQKSKVANLRRNQGGQYSKVHRLLIPATMEALLTEATAKLKLPKAARFLYTLEGVKMESLQHIEDKAELLVSCGERFNQSAARLPEVKHTATPSRGAADSVQLKPDLQMRSGGRAAAKASKPSEQGSAVSRRGLRPAKTKPAEVSPPAMARHSSREPQKRSARPAHKARAPKQESAANAAARLKQAEVDAARAPTHARTHARAHTHAHARTHARALTRTRAHRSMQRRRQHLRQSSFRAGTPTAMACSPSRRSCTVCSTKARARRPRRRSNEPRSLRTKRT